MSKDQIIDADGHIVESTLLPSFRAALHEERVKQGRPPVNRATHTLGGTIGKYEVELESRLCDMDIEGISFSVLFPNRTATSLGRSIISGDGLMISFPRR